MDNFQNLQRQYVPVMVLNDMEVHISKDVCTLIHAHTTYMTAGLIQLNVHDKTIHSRPVRTYVCIYTH